jgi:hypothetical protein
MEVLYPNLEKLDQNKPIYTAEVADGEGDLQRAIRHYGNWLKQNKEKIILIDRIIISEHGYTIAVMYQLKDEISKPSPTF